jgi:WD40 repeat protein
MLTIAQLRGYVQQVNPETGEIALFEKAHEFPAKPEGRLFLTVAAIHPRGASFVTIGGDDMYWKLWDVTTGVVSMTGTTHDHTGICTCTMQKLEPTCQKVAHKDGLSAVAFSPLGQSFATGDKSGRVILWNAETGAGLIDMFADTTFADNTIPAIILLSFSANGVDLASANQKGDIYLWNTATGQKLRDLLQNTTVVLVGSLQFSSNNSNILMVQADHFWSIWNTETDEMIVAHGGFGFAVLSPDDTTIATTRQVIGIRTVLLLNALTGTERARLVLDDGSEFEQVAFSLDSRKVATLACTPISVVHMCMVWDSSTGALLRTIQIQGPYRVNSIVWGPDWVRDTQRAVAFAMGHHERLGDGSRVQALDPGVIRMIVDPRTGVAGAGV